MNPKNWDKKKMYKDEVHLQDNYKSHSTIYIEDNHSLLSKEKAANESYIECHFGMNWDSNKDKVPYHKQKKCSQKAKVKKSRQQAYLTYLSKSDNEIRA